MHVGIGYVDEAFDHEFYVLACVVHDGSEEVRARLRALLLRGQRQLHFTKEGEVRRRALACAVAALELPTVVVVRRSTEPAERRRGQCLVALAWAVANDVSGLVIEARQQRLNEHDARVLAGIGTHGPELDVTFVSANDAEQLWAADIVAGAVFADLARDVDVYRVALEPITVIET